MNRREMSKKPLKSKCSISEHFNTGNLTILQGFICCSFEITDKRMMFVTVAISFRSPTLARHRGGEDIRLMNMKAMVHKNDKWSTSSSAIL